MRHCSLTRIECCPRRSPPSASSRLPGGTRKSTSRVTVSSRNSFRTARSATSRGTRFGAFPAARSAVNLSLNDRIILNVLRNSTSVKQFVLAVVAEPLRVDRLDLGLGEGFGAVHHVLRVEPRD